MRRDDYGRPPEERTVAVSTIDEGLVSALAERVPGESESLESPLEGGGSSWNDSSSRR